MAVASAAAAVALTAGLAAAADAAGLARAEWPSPAGWAVAAPAGAAGAVALLRRGWSAPATFGLLWMAATLAHHALGELVPYWDSEPLDGAVHWLWDAAYHGPSVVVAALGVSSGRP